MSLMGCGAAAEVLRLIGLRPEWRNSRQKARGGWALIPTRTRCIAARSAHARLLRLRGKRSPAPGAVEAEATRVQGEFIRTS